MGPRQAGVELQPSEAQNLADAALFRLQRTALQRAQLDRMAQELPLPQLLLPYVFTSELGPDGLAQLSNGLLAKIRDLPDPSRS